MLMFFLCDIVEVCKNKRIIRCGILLLCFVDAG